MLCSLVIVKEIRHDSCTQEVHSSQKDRQVRQSVQRIQFLGGKLADHDFLWTLSSLGFGEEPTLTGFPPHQWFLHLSLLCWTPLYISTFRKCPGPLPWSSPPLMISNPVALSIIYTLTIPTFISPAQISPLSSVSHMYLLTGILARVSHRNLKPTVYYSVDFPFPQVFPHLQHLHPLVHGRTYTQLLKRKTQKWSLFLPLLSCSSPSLLIHQNKIQNLLLLTTSSALS